MKLHYNIYLGALVISVFLLGFSCKFTNLNFVVWNSNSEIPAKKGQSFQPGLAGAIIGISNNNLIIAGGANFKGGLPWKGGKKSYENTVYVAQKDKNNKLIWIQSADTLSSPLAYAANVAYKNGFISVGGENANGPVASVYYWTWDDHAKKILKNEFPTLPYPITNASAAIFNNQLYVIGGENLNEAFANVWFLNLDDKEKAWQEGPLLPKPISHSVAVVQSNLTDNDHLYVIGGRAKQPNGISLLYNQVLQIDSNNNRWIEKSKIGDGKSTLSAWSATTAITKGDYIFVMGGDDGEIFHQIESFATQAKDAKSQEERNSSLEKQYKLAEEHPGFSKNVYRYHTKKDEWTKINPLPYAPVTTTAVLWEDEIVIPSGEVHPGIRTPKILRANLPK